MSTSDIVTRSKTLVDAPRVAPTIRPPQDLDSAVRLLDATAQRAGFDGRYSILRATGGPTTIRFTSREAYQEAGEYGLIDVENAFYITVEGSEVHVPVLFGHPTRWRAVAIYPAQDRPCRNCGFVYDDTCQEHEPEPLCRHCGSAIAECQECGADENPHWLHDGESSRVDLDAAAQIPVVVVDLPQRTPGAALVDNPPPSGLPRDVLDEFTHRHGEDRTIRVDNDCAVWVLMPGTDGELMWKKAGVLARYDRDAARDLVIDWLNGRARLVAAVADAALGEAADR